MGMYHMMIFHYESLERVCWHHNWHRVHSCRFANNVVICVLLVSWPATMWDIVIVRVVCLCVTREYLPTLSELDLWLVANANRKPRLSIQNLPSDSWSEVRYRHFGCFRFGTLPIVIGMGNLVMSVEHWASLPVCVSFGNFGGISRPPIKLSSQNLVYR